MLPSVRLEEILHPSEREFYAALRDGLPDDYLVLHSYPWLRPGRGDRDRALIEGEADFVILHPEHGLLVIELKGGVVSFDEQRREWRRSASDGPRPLQDPFEQAQRSMYALLDYAAGMTRKKVNKYNIPRGFAVAFPHLDYDGPLPAHVTPELVICHRDLRDIQASVERAFSVWSSGRVFKPRRHALLRDALLPRFRLFRPLGLEIAQDASQLLVLTETQARVFSSLLAGHKRALIEGVAGSGKTLLALGRAQAFARAGARVLLVCFNRGLADWLHEQAAATPAAGTLDVWSFHSLASHLAKRAGVAFKPASGGPRDARFWDEEAALILDQSVGVLESAGEQPRYDAVVVDEGQDFHDGWWDVLVDGLLKDPDEGELFIFFDPAQSLRQVPSLKPYGLTPLFKLSVNCRNTRQIARYSADLVDLEAAVFEHAPEGSPPRVVRASSAEAQARLVVEEVSRLLTQHGLRPEQLVLIGPAALKNSSLAGIERVHDVPLTSDPAAWRAGGRLLVTTARAFKGLEADVALLYDLGGFGAYFTPSDLYVACTRARHSLIAICHDDAQRGRLTRALERAGGATPCR